MFKRWLYRYRRVLIISVVCACLITPAIAAVIRDYRLGDALHAGNLLIGDGSGNYVTIKQPALSADYNFPLPTNDGTNGQVLTTNGSGTASSWSSVSGFGVTTFADLSIPYASATDTFEFDPTNFSFDNTTNGQFLSLGGGTSAGQLRFLEGSGGGTNYYALKAPATLSGNISTILPNSAVVAGDLLYGSSANTLAELAKSTAVGYALRNTGASNVPAWGPVNCVLATNITANSVAGNAGATVFTFTGEGSDTIAANVLGAGQHLHIVADGTVTTDGGESETLALTLKIGSKTIYASPATSYSTASTAVPWRIVCDLTELTAGGTGTARATGIYSTDPGVAGSSVNECFGASITSFDTTATEQVTVTATWANGDASPDVATLDTLQISTNNFD